MQSAIDKLIEAPIRKTLEYRRDCYEDVLAEICENLRRTSEQSVAYEPIGNQLPEQRWITCYQVVDTDIHLQSANLFCCTLADQLNTHTEKSTRYDIQCEKRQIWNWMEDDWQESERTVVTMHLEHTGMLAFMKRRSFYVQKLAHSLFRSFLLAFDVEPGD